MAADYYEILGVTGRVPEDIKARLSPSRPPVHPDVNATPTLKRPSAHLGGLRNTRRSTEAPSVRQYGRVGEVVFPGGMSDIWELFQSAFGGTPSAAPSPRAAAPTSRSPSPWNSRTFSRAPSARSATAVSPSARTALARESSRALAFTPAPPATGRGNSAKPSTPSWAP